MEYFVEDPPQSNNYRAPTGAETYRHRIASNEIKELRDQIKKLTDELEAKTKACTHSVFHDEPSWPYSSRMCATCGALLEML